MGSAYTRDGLYASIYGTICDFSPLASIAAYDVRCSEGAWDMMSVLVMALCNQPANCYSDGTL